MIFTCETQEWRRQNDRFSCVLLAPLSNLSGALLHLSQCGGAAVDEALFHAPFPVEREC
jgi:hypothetical protein